MAVRRRRAAAGQHEFTQRRQFGIPFLDQRFERLDLLGLNDDAPGDRQFAAEVEQVVLDLEQLRCHRRGQVGCASSTPIALLSSSTVPQASMRALSLGTRLPSARPVLPSSPVRVTIFESRLPMESRYLK